ncbi:SigB/SigF/SigG family RNA polymerase sigma factor [Streptomyces sp. NBC_01280]|uniref:SigB/SigF/SigG family RNA polymerase sigma factor n=2 Tax=unclassified Streptomyces TaxID=2593676 RepID=UPI002E34F8F8|nr:SigB/SigF/SigG family RNA polymerase sigma factor [Streptomyces sp. NBC_01280]WSE12005.1 SigB/SigF/SigG family RNA polymerase sigma factor [Streptomyces sp. NBC_01397]WSE19621.1 SigB/SigF/SigG family RNA polymerase sigma factor [Streptomyces sp. NBC_01397]
MLCDCERTAADDSPDTSAVFARLAGLGEGPERDLLCEEAVKAWLPMAHRIAGRFRDKGESLEDLKQIAAMGLVKAVNNYDPQRGPFEPYAVPTIRGELRRHFRDHTWDVHVPRRVQDLRNRVRRARRDLSQQPGAGPEPSIGGIAERAGLTEDEVRDGLQAIDGYNALSLDAGLLPCEDAFLVDGLGATEGAYDVVTDREAAKAGLGHLSDRERAILYMRFFEDMTQSRIAEKFGISQVHVSRIIRESCRRVRDATCDWGRFEKTRAA